MDATARKLRHQLRFSMHPVDRLGIVLFFIFLCALYAVSLSPSWQIVGGAWVNVSGEEPGDVYTWMLAILLTIIVFGVLTYYLIEKRLIISEKDSNLAEEHIHHYLNKHKKHVGSIEELETHLLSSGYHHDIVHRALQKHRQ